MHLLELAKVVWNDIVKNGEDRVKRRTARNYATAARGVLSVFGEEGDLLATNEYFRCVESPRAVLRY